MSSAIPYSEEVTEVLGQLWSNVDITKESLHYSLASIAFNPIFWNIAARTEYSTHLLTKIAGGDKKRGCYLLAFTIFSLGIYRDLLFKQALEEQVKSPLLDCQSVKYAGAAFFSLGNLFVLTSMYALGVTGTYLGDYFGILMDERVTGFPFSVVDNPMYIGSTLSFLGTSLYYGKPAGVLITLFVHIMYTIALKFEEYVLIVSIFLSFKLLTFINFTDLSLLRSTLLEIKILRSSTSTCDSIISHTYK
ncbi:hypothetical protein WICPIJ_009847 [Wickerhamomyces pijperi]|uniref:Phosphatidyl-N-methylethanolamine N-methyltransferase n=1 Tax=Wickerhamomyces pijperi TaxID=599730 RepID=A0A9P8PJL2_WICPI|nr:hypothetical protein WICPIJ_009847 [Wickerhamomyces pijperi]